MSSPGLMIYSSSKLLAFAKLYIQFRYYVPTELLAGVTEGDWDEPMALGEALSKSRMDSF